MERFLTHFYRIPRLQRYIMALLLVILIVMTPTLFSTTPVSGEIRYTLAWDTEGITRTANGWEVVNDLGYRVQVEQGYLVSNQTRLIPCEHTHGLIEWLQHRLGLRTAKAGHGADVDEAAILDASVESLTAFTPFAFGSVTVHEPSYCQAHYLAARALRDTRNFPTDTDLFNITVWVSGTYSDAEQTNVPFSISTNLNYGQIIPLQTPRLQSIHAEVGAQPIEVEVVRSVHHLFDGVDFVSMDGAQQGKAVLWNLLKNLRAQVVSGQTHGM